MIGNDDVRSARIMDAQRQDHRCGLGNAINQFIAKPELHASVVSAK